MATSSITANFVMSDPKVSRAFARALLARRPSGKVTKRRAGGAYSGGSLDVGKYNTFQYGWVNSGNCYLDSSRVNVHDGGKIKCYGLAFGRDRNLHMSVTNGASIEASYYVQIGRQTKALDSPLTAFLGISNATFNAGATLDVSNGSHVTLFSVDNRGGVVV